MLGLHRRSLCLTIFTRKVLKEPYHRLYNTATSFMNLNKINELFQIGQHHLASDFFIAAQYSTSHYWAPEHVSQGFQTVEVSSSPAGKYKCNVSGRDSVMYLSTFSFPFQFGSINSGDEWVNGWEKSPSHTRELTCQCPLLTRSSLACCYESTDISTFTLT